MPALPVASFGPSRTFTALSAVSLLLAVAVTFLWMRSVRKNDVLILPKKPGDHWLVTSAFGTITIQLEQSQKGQIKPGWVFIANQLPRNWPNDWRWFYFRFYHGMTRHYLPLRASRVDGVSAPHWFFIGLFAGSPVAWYRQLRRRRERFDQGLCRKCGYDLRATAIGGGPLLERCPECGLTTAKNDRVLQAIPPQNT